MAKVISFVCELGGKSAAYTFLERGDTKLDISTLISYDHYTFFILNSIKYYILCSMIEKIKRILSEVGSGVR